MVIYLNRSATRRATRIEQVTRLQREILTDVRDNFVHLVEHVTGTTFLHIFSVQVEMEMNSLYVSEFLYIYPFTDNGRTVESFR